MNNETFVATLAEILGVPPQQDIRLAILERASTLRAHTEPIWDLVAAMDDHLDAHVADAYKDQPLAQDAMRVAKIGEELGEAIDAYIAWTGQNPRKGVCGGRPELLNELADVTMTGILAIQHFTKDVTETRSIVEEKSRAIHLRMIEWEMAQP